MLRTNLSTRPFYNERVVYLGLSLVALIVLAVTAVNLFEVVRLSRQNTGLAAHIRDDRSAAAELTRKARETRQGIDQDELKVIAAAAREANTLIDGRTFSWTALFNQLEATLPPEVMLASVRPTIDEDGTRITLIVLGRRTADLDEFVEKLEATGSFENVLPRQRNLNDDGLTQVSIEAMYIPDVPESTAKPPTPAVAKTASSAGAGGGR
jgi:Tfp pilus assembly protein PilN